MQKKPNLRVFYLIIFCGGHSGVFAAAHDLKMEWVVIKGISDYADGSKSKTQAWRPFASVMAASVVANILKVPGLLKDWQHYKGVNHKQEGKLHSCSVPGFFSFNFIDKNDKISLLLSNNYLNKSQILKETSKNRAPI